jgi:hypothetical protein
MNRPSSLRRTSIDPDLEKPVAAFLFRLIPNKDKIILNSDV